MVQTTARILATAFAIVTLAPFGAGAATDGPRRVIALKRPAPSWYGDDLHRRVLAAGPRGVPLPREARGEIPASSVAFLGIRPGQLIIVNGRALCSSSFVFTDGAGRYSIGTAGHCGKAGDPVVMVFAPLGLVRIGTISKSVDDGIGNDYAFISIDPALNRWVSPSMAHWGGPTGVYAGSGPVPVHHTGWGLVVGTGGTPRAGVGYRFGADEWRFEGAIAPGDSGSGAIVTGGAGAGNITHIVVNTREAVPAYMAGTSLAKIVGASGMQLATCPPIPWPAPGCPPLP